MPHPLSRQQASVHIEPIFESALLLSWVDIHQLPILAVSADLSFFLSLTIVVLSRSRLDISSAFYPKHLRLHRTTSTQPEPPNVEFLGKSVDNLESFYPSEPEFGGFAG